MSYIICSALCLHFSFSPGRYFCKNPTEEMDLSCSSVKVLLFLMNGFHQMSADTHSLQYCYTGVTPAIHIPEFTAVGLVDGELSEYYDSNIRSIIPKTEWIKKVDADHPYYWSTETEVWQDEEEWLKHDVVTAMNHFNQTEGVHTVQLMFGCEIDDDGTTRVFSHFGYDGEDFISLDLKTKTWTAASIKTLITKKKWNPTGHKAKGCTLYLENECIDWLKKFVSYRRDTLERKVCPTASVFQKHSPSPELVCHATGFFPKAVNITWRKDGEDVHEDVELRETLPNQDRSFQKRSILKVPAEELQKHTYTCVIQHSSLEKEIVLEVPKGGGSMAIIIGVVVALIVLVAVVAGIMVWKKKNSGFKRAPASEESSSPNS
ncbi:BOLA class I histocompatibility antigen, alpha chain BL3-7-like isoform X1 [Tachysurus fulvidraco]|uniref:BOLA class I histocompatibility antigen, alpha chain BL3-7-like isoform X1 n=1 Tax=Tachysurus fulvidraco TaxID=1234273 RepID=UPI001FEE4552|nr:BOLA class I histocompatibility antigen, alpha chain BL3-7-like isoform X1 [Tachysurus fulvidraco]